MKLQLQDLKTNPHQELRGEITEFSKLQKLINNPLVQKIVKVVYHLKLDFSGKTSVLKIQGPIEFDLQVLDANDGQEFLDHQKVEWNDEYSFAENWQGDKNFVVGPEFDFLAYLGEQINLNLPLNLSKKHDIISKSGSGWEFLSESDYQKQKQQNNDPDPRWEKLNQWKNK